MKKFFSVLIALVICLSSAISVLAAGDEFVPSIPDKGAPDIVEIEDEDGNKHIAVIIDEDEEIVAYVNEGCLIITPVSEAEESKDIPEDAKKQLLDLYEGLKDGTITIPYELVSSDIDPDKMVIRDLFDASWLCEDHPKLLAEEGNVIEIIFDLGVKASTNVVALVYNGGEWTPAVKTVNNNDGTVTVTLEHLGAITFSVLESSYDDPAKLGDDSNVILWGVLLAASAAGLVVAFAVRRKTAR